MTASVSAGTVFLDGSCTLLNSEAPAGHSVAESCVYTLRGPMVCSSIISSVSQFRLDCRPFSINVFPCFPTECTRHKTLMWPR